MTKDTVLKIIACDPNFDSLNIEKSLGDLTALELEELLQNYNTDQKLNEPEKIGLVQDVLRLIMSKNDQNPTPGDSQPFQSQEQT